MKLRKALLSLMFLFACQKNNFNYQDLDGKIYIDVHFSKNANRIIKKELLEKFGNTASTLNSADYILVLHSYTIDTASSDLSGVPYIKRNSIIINYELFKLQDKSPEALDKIEKTLNPDKFSYEHPEVSSKFIGIGVAKDTLEKMIQRKSASQNQLFFSISAMILSSGVVKSALAGAVSIRNLKPINLYNAESIHMDDIESEENFANSAADLIFQDLCLYFMEDEKSIKNKTDEKDGKLLGKNKKIESEEYQKYRAARKKSKQGIVEEFVDIVKDND